MFATTSSALPIAVSVPDVAKAIPQPRRRIGPERGRALEKLRHAIEYLVDEHVNDLDSPDASIDRLAAVELLMGLLKQVYTEAPVIQPLNERFRRFWAELL